MLFTNQGCLLVKFFCLASEPEKSNLFKKEKYYSLQRKVKIKCQVFQKCKGNKKKNEWQKKAFRAEKNNSELKEKGHEPSRKSLSSARTHH
jgi:hypothetical protein